LTQRIQIRTLPVASAPLGAGLGRGLRLLQDLDGELGGPVAWLVGERRGLLGEEVEQNLSGVGIRERLREVLPLVIDEGARIEAVLVERLGVRIVTERSCNACATRSRSWSAATRTDCCKASFSRSYSRTAASARRRAASCCLVIFESPSPSECVSRV